MPIFISYSHHDKEFADRLAAQLVMNKAKVWIDRWELNVGDSIISNVQSAIQSASALIVILTKSSVNSEWCKKELNSGLIRELEEKRVVVLPALLEDCDVPIFLREKMYADFRSNFDDGLRTILEAIAKVTSDTLGRVEHPEFHIDWAIDWGMEDDLFMLRITLVEQAMDKPYSVITEIYILANEYATTIYKIYESNGLDWWGRFLILNALSEMKDKKGLFFILDDSFQKSRNIRIQDKNSQKAYEILVKCRRVGKDTGKNINIDYGSQFGMIRIAIQKTIRKPTPDEYLKIKNMTDQVHNIKS